MGEPEFVGVPGYEWWRVRDDASSAKALSFCCWIVLAILLFVLLRKGVVSLADFGLAGG